MKRFLPVLTMTVLLASACIGTPQDSSAASPKSVRALGAGQAPEAWVPENVEWDASGNYARPLAEGVYKVLPSKIVEFPSFDGTRIQTAVWRPDVPEGMKVPVILDVGPYYGDAIENARRRTIVDGLVPHGFAYANVAIRGTSGSGGCMEFFGVNEQKDVDAAVTFYGEQPWGNGNVALIGISYDGTTAWIGAQYGNPHLKTIVPISGLTSIYDHGVRNGTAWGFEPEIHVYYWTFGFQTNRRTPEDKLENVACPEAVRGGATAQYTTVTGERDEPPAFDGYWEERDFKPEILANYNGSVFLVQGLRDWRVPSYLAFPFMQDMQAAGIETKMLLGQWWHNVPDNAGEHTRWDYGEMLLRWFQKYLYGTEGVNTGPLVDVEDDQGAWRTESNWPPPDAAWATWYLGANTLRTGDGAAGEQLLFSPASAYQVVTDQAPQGRGSAPVPLVEYRATTGPLEADLRFAGLPRLHVTFLPSSPTGNRVQAQLLDRAPDGTERDVGHAVMDLRFHEGGYQSHVLTPGEPIRAKMEFLPLDARIPAGHELVLKVTGAGYSGERLTRGGSGYLDQWIPGPAELPLRIAWGNDRSALMLPLIDRDVGDGKYPGEP